MDVASRPSPRDTSDGRPPRGRGDSNSVARSPSPVSGRDVGAMLHDTRSTFGRAVSRSNVPTTEAPSAEDASRAEADRAEHDREVHHPLTRVGVRPLLRPCQATLAVRPARRRGGAGRPRVVVAARRRPHDLRLIQGVYPAARAHPLPIQLVPAGMPRRPPPMRGFDVGADALEARERCVALWPGRQLGPRPSRATRSRCAPGRPDLLPATVTTGPADRRWSSRSSTRRPDRSSRERRHQPVEARDRRPEPAGMVRPSRLAGSGPPGETTSRSGVRDGGHVAPCRPTHGSQSDDRSAGAFKPGRGRLRAMSANLSHPDGQPRQTAAVRGGHERTAVGRSRRVSSKRSGKAVAMRATDTWRPGVTDDGKGGTGLRGDVSSSSCGAAGCAQMRPTSTLRRQRRPVERQHTDLSNRKN